MMTRFGELQVSWKWAAFYELYETFGHPAVRQFPFRPQYTDFLLAYLAGGEL